MTIKQALAIKVKKLSLSSEDLDLLLEESKLIGAADYNFDLNGKDIDLAYAGLLLETIHVSEKKEDDVTIKYSTDMKGIYSAIMRKWGLVDPFAPVIKKPSVRQKVGYW